MSKAVKKFNSLNGQFANRSRLEEVLEMCEKENRRLLVARIKKAIAKLPKEGPARIVVLEKAVEKSGLNGKVVNLPKSKEKTEKATRVKDKLLLQNKQLKTKIDNLLKAKDGGQEASRLYKKLLQNNQKILKLAKKYPQIYPAGLSAPWHEGLAKQALNNCSRLNPGYKYDKNGELQRANVSLKTLKDIANKATDFESAYKAVLLLAVPANVVKVLREKYNKDLKLNPKEVFHKFYNDVTNTNIKNTKKKKPTADTSKKSDTDHTSKKEVTRVTEKKAVVAKEEKKSTHRFTKGQTVQVSKRWGNTQPGMEGTIKQLRKSVHGDPMYKVLLNNGKDVVYPEDVLQIPTQGKLFGTKSKKTVPQKRKTVTRKRKTVTKKTKSGLKSPNIEPNTTAGGNCIGGSTRPLNSGKHPKAIKFKKPDQKNPLFPVVGETRKFFGKIEKKPVHSVVITLDTEKGVGKTTSVYNFLNDFHAAGNKCMFASLEEHPGSNLAIEKAEKYFSDAAREEIDAFSEFKDVAEFLSVIQHYDVIAIDSWQKLIRMLGPIYLDEQLRMAFDGKLFLIVFQQRSDGKTKGGSDIEFDGDIITKGHKGASFSENYLFFDKNRYTEHPIEELKYFVGEQKTYIEGENIAEAPPQSEVLANTAENEEINFKVY